MAKRTKKASRRRRRKAERRPRRGWVRMRTAKLLDVRIRDLDLRLEGTWVGRCIDRVREELGRRDLRFRPYFWISDEWFTPDGYTGTAVPFYLLHPRLVRLERNRMGYVEGATRDWCLRILRHETGHALDHAYGLHRRRRWQRLFGPSSRRYPRYYQPNPYSRRHVQHLEYWYAQSHPDEDFAETFAVWLAQPRAWRKRYAGWPALRKLEYVDELMAEIAGEWPEERTRGVVEPASKIYKTLRQYYSEKRHKAEKAWPRFYDRDLRRLFSEKPRHSDREAASSFIRRVRAQVLRELDPWLGEHSYHLKHVLVEMLGRCSELKLRAVGTDLRLRRGLTILLAKYTTDALYRRRGWIEL
ncbi:MAG: putative zinc-binding metallopeptidase [Planctomycetota bacterium]